MNVLKTGRRISDATKRRYTQVHLFGINGTLA